MKAGDLVRYRYRSHNDTGFGLVLEVLEDNVKVLWSTGESLILVFRLDFMEIINESW